MISCEPFFRTMKEKGITSYKMAKMGFPISSYHVIRRGKNIFTHTIGALCDILDCDVADVMEFRRNTDSTSEHE